MMSRMPTAQQSRKILGVRDLKQTKTEDNKETSTPAAAVLIDNINEVDIWESLAARTWPLCFSEWRRAGRRPTAR